MPNASKNGNSFSPNEILFSSLLIVGIEEFIEKAEFFERESKLDRGPVTDAARIFSNILDSSLEATMIWFKLKLRFDVEVSEFCQKKCAAINIGLNRACDSLLPLLRECATGNLRERVERAISERSAKVRFYDVFKPELDSFRNDLESLREKIEDLKRERPYLRKLRWKTKTKKKRK